MRTDSEEGLPIKIKSLDESLIAVKQSSTTETTQSYLSNEPCGKLWR